MIIPVRCFTCGGVVGSAYETFAAAVEAGKSGQEALDATGLERFCCRRMVVAHKPLAREAAHFE